MVFGAVLGTQTFVKWAQRKLDRKKEDREVARLKAAIRRPKLRSICEGVARMYGMEVTRIRKKGCKENVKRDLAIYLSRECSGLRHIEIGQYFGGILPSAVSSSCRRVEEKMEEDRGWTRIVLQLVQRFSQGR